MNINELGEDLEQQFGKPRNITEENVRFMLSLIKEEFDGTKVNENVEKPSLDAFGMTILAVMSYQTTPWEELAKKPSIRKTLKYIAIRGNCHYDEMEALTKELIRKHFDGLFIFLPSSYKCFYCSHIFSVISVVQIYINCTTQFKYCTT